MTKEKKYTAKQKEAHADRVRLFQILCALDSCGEALQPDELAVRLQTLFVNDDPDAEVPHDAEPTANVVADLDALSRSCVEACKIWSRCGEIDGLISPNMTGWTLDRLTVVDRAIIRLAVYECLIARSVNVQVALSEAVLLAQEYGRDESSRFVNGVLARVVRAVEND
ncbi:MAG: transcription antitermination factor NusB, partial [Pyramidobacter sp.]